MNKYSSDRGNHEKITQKSIADFIETLEVSDAIKAELKQITPAKYTGV